MVVTGFHCTKYNSFPDHFEAKERVQHFTPTKGTNAFFEDNEIIWGDDEDDDDGDLDILLSAKYPSNVKMKNENFMNIELEDLDDTNDSYYENLFSQADTTTPKYDSNQDVVIYKEDTQETFEAKYMYDNNKMLKHDRNHLQKEMNSMRAKQSQKKRLKRLEERASLLALRALRQTMATETVARSPKPDLVLNKTHRYLHPIPTFSHSASINYRKTDESDIDVLDFEKKLFGQRFQNAYGVYFRLLKTLDEVKCEAKEDAKERIMEHVEKQASRHISDSSEDPDLQDDEATVHSIRSHLRLRSIVTLSLHESKQFPSEEVQIYGFDEKTKSIQTLTSWKSLQTSDLVYILNIRGNMKRGRSPTDRFKVIRKLEESLRLPLF